MTNVRAFALIALLALIAYAPSLGMGIFLDDATNLLNSREAPWSLESLGRAFRFKFQDLHDGVVPPYLSGGPRFFRPLTVAMVKLETGWFGTDFWRYHLVNILLEALAGCLFYLFALGVFQDHRRALRAACLFVVCYLNVITVSWLSTRGDLLLTCFSLGPLLTVQWLPEIRDPTRRRALGLLGLLCFVAALLTKEGSASLPLLIGFFVFWRERERGRSLARAVRTGFLWASLPLLALGSYLHLRSYVLGGIVVPDFYFYLFPPTSWLFPWFALMKLVWSPLQAVFFLPPLQLRYLVDHFWFQPIFWAVALPFLRVLWHIVGPCWVREPVARFALPAFFIALIPTLPLMPFPHYLFLPSLFSSLLLTTVLWPTTATGTTRETPTETPPDGAEPLPPLTAWKKAYLGGYLTAFLLAMGLIVGACTIVAGHMERYCARLGEIYDRYQASEHARQTGDEPEIYVFDAQLIEIHLFNEFRFRYPERARFKGFYLNLVELFPYPSKISIDPASATVLAPPDHLFSSGLFFESTFGPEVLAQARAPLSCPFYRWQPLPTPGETQGIGGYRIEFDAVRSHPARRLYVTGARRGFEISPPPPAP